jgi:adenylate cyclase
MIFKCNGSHAGREPHIGGFRAKGADMEQGSLQPIVDWLARAAIDGVEESELLAGMCRRSRAAGIPVARATALIDTLHPTWEGRAFRWRHDGREQNTTIEYGSSSHGDPAQAWLRSPFRHLLETNASEFRRALQQGGDIESFGVLPELRDEGHTDYIALIHRFAPQGSMGEMDCFYAQWSTDSAGGFSDADVAALRHLMPVLALAIKCGALKRIVGTLSEVYLGRDPAQQVLSGRISRGVAERIHAVLWFSDLRSFTTISDAAAPEQIIPLLNDYAAAVIGAIEAQGGDVLKLIGDGVLAIFKADDTQQAISCALRAGRAMRLAVAALNDQRASQGLPTTIANLGLHIGEVFYGNIGSDTRLDFTVVGPAVNEVSRIVSMCRSVDRSILLSADLVAAMTPAERAKFASVGRYALRGVGRAQELFTLDPELM